MNLDQNKAGDVKKRRNDGWGEEKYFKKNKKEKECKRVKGFRLRDNHSWTPR